MSRCRCCNKVLTTFELTRKNEATNEYLDMCNTCVNESGILQIVNVLEREDLRDISDDIDFEEVVEDIPYFPDTD